MYYRRLCTGSCRNDGNLFLFWLRTVENGWISGESVLLAARRDTFEKSNGRSQMHRTGRNEMSQTHARAVSATQPHAHASFFLPSSSSSAGQTCAPSPSTCGSDALFVVVHSCSLEIWRGAWIKAAVLKATRPQPQGIPPMPSRMAAVCQPYIDGGCTSGFVARGCLYKIDGLAFITAGVSS